MKDVNDFFINELKSVYSNEKQSLDEFPDIIEAVTSPKLKEALLNHLDETKEQIRRLEMIAKELNFDYGRTSNDVMKALLKEARTIVKSNYDAIVKDAALINCIQHIELYEIASYGLLKTFAKHFNHGTVHDLLDATSKEEGRMNKSLNEIAEGSDVSKGVNAEACKLRAA